MLSLLGAVWGISPYWVGIKREAIPRSVGYSLCDGKREIEVGGRLTLYPGLVARSDYLPVNDRPYVLDVVCTAILVAEVVGVLPDVDPHEGAETMYNRVAPVRLLGDHELTILLSSKPSPARSEEGRAGGEELSLEGLEATPLCYDRIEELALRRTTSVGSELREVEVVVEELACIVEDRPLALAYDLLDGGIGKLCAFNEGVEGIDIAS